MEGISSRQGGHQVAQKFNITTLPFKSESLNVLPSATDVTVISGAGAFSAATALAFRATGASFLVQAVNDNNRHIVMMLNRSMVTSGNRVETREIVWGAVIYCELQHILTS